MNMMVLNYTNNEFEYHNHDHERVFYGKTESEAEFKNHCFLLENDLAYLKLMNEDASKEIDVEFIESSNFDVGMTSLIGTGNDFPLDHGNYWSIVIDDKYYAVVNMWAENFEEAVKLFNIKSMKFIIINGFCIIDDNDIPRNWFLDNLFLKYNINRSVSFVENMKLSGWYHNYIKKEN